MNTQTLTTTLAKIKDVPYSAISNLDMNAYTFEIGNGVYSFDLTPSGKMIKSGSVKYIWSNNNTVNYGG